MFLCLSAIWGSSFLFIHVGLEEGIGPLTIVSQRTIWGVLMLGVTLIAWGGRLPLSARLWGRLTILGLTNIVVPFALIAWGQQYITTGVTSILNAMVPLFTVIIAMGFLRDEALSRARLAGLGIGFGGVVLLMLPSLSDAPTDQRAGLAVLGMAAVAAAAVSYGIAAVYTRRQVSGQAIVTMRDGTLRAPTAVEIGLGSTLAAGIIITPLAMLVEHPAGGLYAWPASTEAWFAMLWLGLLGTGVAYLLFFRIIERWGATRTTLVTYVIPVVAIALGFVLLGERLRPLELIGAALVIGGVVLVNARLGGGRNLRRRTVEASSES